MDTGVHTFLKGISPKVNVIALRQLEYYCRISVNSIEYIEKKRPPSVILLRINRWMDTTHANELDRSILVKWANPHAVHMLLMHSLIKEVSFSWLAFQGASHVTIGLKVSAIHWCSIIITTVHLQRCLWY